MDVGWAPQQTSESHRNGGGGAGAVQEAEVPQKKKRKQLVACDSCRLRRVKCNKADTGDTDCSECLKKSIRCTDSYIRTKPRVVRSGKLIQQAKILYGDGEENSPIKLESPGHSPGGAQGSPPATVILAADARFVNSELARAISDHLIQTFRDCVHAQCSVVDWERFETSWDQAGHISENLSPTNECLSLVMQAWAARFSDNAAIVGAGAPPLSELNKHPPGTNLTEYGQAREVFAKAMADRAMNMLDRHGALRRPSGQCCAALVLMEYFSTYGDVYRNEGRHLMTAAAEHLRSRNDGVSDDPTEVLSSQDRMSGGTLFWVVYTRDALSSAFGGRATALTSEDLAVLCEVLANPLTVDVLTYVSSDNPQLLGGLAVIATFRHITTIVRSFCNRVSGPMARRQRIDGAAIQDMWAGLEQSSHFNDIWRQSMARLPVDNSDGWLRDITAMRCQITHAIHINIVDRLEIERGRLATSRDPLFSQYLESILRLKQQSDEKLLGTSREMARLVRHTGADLVFKCALSAENLPLYTSHMLSMPVWEQGGSEGWTYAVKQEEVRWMIDALKLLGWSWAGFGQHVQTAEESLDDLTDQITHARRQEQQQRQHQQQQQKQLHNPQQQPSFDLHHPVYADPSPWYPSFDDAPLPQSLPPQSYANFDCPPHPQLPSLLHHTQQIPFASYGAVPLPPPPPPPHSSHSFSSASGCEGGSNGNPLDQLGNLHQQMYEQQGRRRSVMSSGGGGRGEGYPTTEYAWDGAGGS